MSDRGPSGESGEYKDTVTPLHTWPDFVARRAARLRRENKVGQDSTATRQQRFIKCPTTFPDYVSIVNETHETEEVKKNRLIEEMRDRIDRFDLDNKEQ